jgi:putative ABC transport system permease protein
LLVSSGLYSATWLLLGKPNQFLDSQFTLVGDVTGSAAAWRLLVWLVAIAILVVAAISAFGQFLGLRLRALGENPLLEHELGASITKYSFFSLAAANGFVGLAGALFAATELFGGHQHGNRRHDNGLTGMILGLLLTRQRRKLTIVAMCIFAGAILHKLIVFLALEAGMPAESLRLVTAVFLVGIFFLLRNSRDGLSERSLKWNWSATSRKTFRGSDGEP